MALSSESSTRANIRIEIKNDFTERNDEEMSVDLSESEVEDGEIDEPKEEKQQDARNTIAFPRSVVPSRSENQWVNGDGGFTTGVEIFEKEEQEKLQTRAQRFGLNPAESTTMTDEQLQELHSSLGITQEDQTDTRFEAIHMYGTTEMSTQDVFGYFGKYGPASIEWINDISCNVVWHDKTSAARAFIGLSKPIRGMPVSGDCNPFVEKEEKEKSTLNQGRSILLVGNDDDMDIDKENDRREGIKHVSEIDIPVPPGYWRLGYRDGKAEWILLRFAKRTDKKPFKAEKFSEYYKKYGNPNYGGMAGLISESKKRKIRSKNFRGPDDTPPAPIEKGNPWGSLAKNWNEDIQERPILRKPAVEEAFDARKKLSPATGPSKSLLERIGPNPQKRYHSDDEKEEKPKTSKVPRMKMYADEEEARIRRAKELKKIRLLEDIEKQITENTQVQDLRNRLGKRNIKEDRRKLGEHLSKPISIRRSSEEDSEEDYGEEPQTKVTQKSKVAVVIRKPHKPTVASTVWSRLDMEKEKQKNLHIKMEKSDSESSSSKSSTSSESEESNFDSDDDEDEPAVKPLSERPTFKTAELKSRLGVKEHKSPLRIEINNDHYKKDKK